MSLHFENLYTSDLVTITDARCRPLDAGCGAEEVARHNDIVIPRRGCFVQRIGRREMVADANTVLFFRRNQPYRVSHPVPGGDDCTSFSFAPRVLADAFAAFSSSTVDFPDEPFHTARTPCSSDTMLLLHRIRQSLRGSRGMNERPSRLHIDEQAMRFLEEVALAGPPPQVKSKGKMRADTKRAHRDLAENARVELARHIGDRVTLPMISRSVCASPFHLARVFRQMTGMSLHGYLTHLRLREAFERLSNGAADLTTLAIDLGFSSHSHFTYTFAREYGLTPSDVRCGHRSARRPELRRPGK